MKSASLCYLDNAATSFPKPKRVVREITKCLEDYCGNPGRAGHALSLAAANKIFDCRVEASRLVGLDSPENIVFVPGATFGLNLIIKGILHEGDHVLISDMEHNSVLRPISRLAREGKIKYDLFPALSLGKHFSPQKVCKEIEKLILPCTRLLICTHQSNVCSCTLPISEIGALCKRHGIIFAVDAAQSAGHIPINMEAQSIDLLCAPSHKGLLGPQGSGFVAINAPLVLDTLIEGGNGISSLSDDMPQLSPERYESGTLATPCIAGLCEGLRELERIGIEQIRENDKRLFCELRDGLSLIKGVILHAPEHEGSTLLFQLKNIPSDKVAHLLDRSKICVRAGFHCSALAHSALGTYRQGAVRVSFGAFNTKKDTDRLLYAINGIVKDNI